MKLCIKCNIEKESNTDNFYKNKKSKDGYRTYCKECMLKDNKKSKEIYRSLQSTKIKEKEYNRKWNIENKDKRKEYKIQNKDRFNLLRNINRNIRYHTDINFNIEHRYRSRLQNALKLINIKKKNKTIDYLGCSIEFLKDYIESLFKDNMNWNNRNLWHIDHIIPCCSFDLSNESELYTCFHYSNLRPIWAEDNLLKIKEDLLYKKQKNSKL